MSRSPTEGIETALCIAGAHRSGTSMVTRLLHHCGLFLGPESDLMPPQADNPDGFWENLRFVAINDEILNSLGGAWDLPPAASEKMTGADLDIPRTKARELVQEFGAGKHWGWKDPRNNLTLPFWRELIPRLKVLIVVRNPLEVAYSMRSRNRTSYAFGLRLWEIYNRRVLQWTRPEERLITHYDAFFENSEEELRRIAQFVGLPLTDTRKVAALITSGKRHTQFTTDQLIEARISPALLDLYRELSVEAGRPEEAMRASRSQLLSDETTSSTVDMLPGAASRLDVSVPDLEPIRRELAELRGTNLHLKNEVSGLSRDLTFVRERFMQTNDMLRHKSIALAESESHVTELLINLRRQLHITKRLSRLLDEFQDATMRLRSSRRWKMANPISALKAKLSGKLFQGYGHLEKTVSHYSQWRAAHPEIAELDSAIQRYSSTATAFTAPASSHVFEPRPPMRPIEFPAHDQVDVSIIIPVYNQVRFTEACLASIQEHQGSERFEVIVVDDGSTDATPKAISQLPGVTYLPNEKNIGFIASCNYGAQKARGSYLLFLNNDTTVTAGWLRSLLDTFSFEPRAGLVGSKLIYPDGRLQEAGGIIWRDGSGWNRGKFGDTEKPEYNFLREVDYCSGACLMIPKSLFESLGGFDSKYTPAYYEDTDLAFKVRRLGYKVFYQPTSEVIHYEGVTGGTDISAGAKKYQEINRATFTDSWAKELAEKPANGDIVSYERLKPGQKRILVIDHHLPMPDRDSGSLRMSQILNILHRLGHRVTFLPDNVADIAPYADELRKRGTEVLCYPHIKNIRSYLEEHGEKFDAVILSRCDFAVKHMDEVRLHAPQSRVIFDTVDLHFVRENREAEITQDAVIRETARDRETREYELIDKANETWVVSECERDLLRAQRPQSAIEVVSNIVEAPGSVTPFSLRRDFLFIGGFQHTPNVDAVLFFMNEIYPMVQARLDGPNFYIIGDKAPPAVIALASEKVIITGLQPDVRPYFDTVKLSIAPLRYGAGVKGKINQSMGLGVPVVGTTVAVEGMNLTNREDILIADSPENFAEAMIELYESEELWERVSKNGVNKTRATYSAETATKQLSRLFSDSHFEGNDVPVANEDLASVDAEASALHHHLAR